MQTNEAVLVNKNSEQVQGCGLTAEIEQTASTIMLAAESLKKQLKKLHVNIDDKQAQLCFEAFEQSALRLSRTAENLEEVRLIRSGKCLADMKPIDLCEQFAKTLELCSSVAEKKAEMHFCNRLPQGTCFVTDARMADKILLNLISNSLRTANQVEVAFYMENEKIVLSVKDNGKGIPEQIQNHLFEPFAADHLPNQQDGGIGLGLYLVKEYCNLLGWNINIESNKNGTCVELIIPPKNTEESDLNSTTVDLAFKAEQKGRVELELSVLLS